MISINLSILIKAKLMGEKFNHAWACIAHAKRTVESFVGIPKPVDDLCHRFLEVFHPIDRHSPFVRKGFSLTASPVFCMTPILGGCPLIGTYYTWLNYLRFYANLSLKYWDFFKVYSYYIIIQFFLKIIQWILLWYTCIKSAWQK